MMNAPHSLATLGLPLALLLAAAAWDARSRRIPNALTATLAATALVHAFMRGGPWGFGLSLAAAAAAIGILFLPFSLRWMGGGDVKLLAASAAWLGLSRLPSLLLASAVAGGLVSIATYLAASRAARLEVGANLSSFAIAPSLAAAGLRPSSSRPRVPYGIGIAAAAAALLVTAGGG